MPGKLIAGRLPRTLLLLRDGLHLRFVNLQSRGASFVGLALIEEPLDKIKLGVAVNAGLLLQIDNVFHAALKGRADGFESILEIDAGNFRHGLGRVEIGVHLIGVEAVAASCTRALRASAALTPRSRALRRDRRIAARLRPCLCQAADNADAPS
jgi:hypothetical protein